MIKQTTVIVLCCSSLLHAQMCWKKTESGVKQEVACAEDSAKFMLDEVAPGKGHQQAWQTGEETVVNAPSMVKHDQDWDESVKREIDSVGKSTQPVASTHTVTLKGAAK